MESKVMVRWDAVGPFGSSMAMSEGTGLHLLGSGRFAADLIHFEPGRGVPCHTHPGSHILICTHGRGFLFLGGNKHEIVQGHCYFVPPMAPHAVYAAKDEAVTLISVADDHRPVDATSRLAPAEPSDEEQSEYGDVIRRLEARSCPRPKS